MIPILEPGEGYDEAAPTSIGRSPGSRAQIAALGAIGATDERYAGFRAFTITPVATCAWRSGEIVFRMTSISSGVNRGYLAASSIPYGW
jgi:hypothetical protein